MSDTHKIQRIYSVEEHTAAQLQTSKMVTEIHFQRLMGLAFREHIQLCHFIFTPAPWAAFRLTVYRIWLLFLESGSICW